ncbi:hypothetical protein Hamer_G010058, partial [Homarus americanus]
MVAIIIGDEDERCVCSFVATDDPHVDPSHGPTPELTPGDNSPDGGSVEVTPVTGVPAASSILAAILSPEADIY